MRIISGTMRGRDLGSVPEGVRPTSDRVRESLFSILGSVDGQHVLDLFAGSGALGIEAYSRGAATVTFAEKSKKVVRALRDRLKSVGLETKGPEAPIRIWPIEAKKAIRKLAEADGLRFDLVFVDPPYADLDRVEVLEAIFAASILSADATVVLEAPTRDPQPAVAGAKVLDSRRYGDTTLVWLTADLAEADKT